MTMYQQARRLMNLRVYFILAIVLIGIVGSVLGGQIQRIVVKPCQALPEFRPDVPAELQSRLRALHERELLQCSAPVAGITSLSEPVYWGSDGLTSILFFQPEDMDRVTLVRYGFGTSATGEAFVPGEPGASPPQGFREVTLGQPARSNQAPSGSKYFVREHGAPVPSDTVVSVSLSGPAETPSGAGARDVFRDIEMAWSWLQRKPARVVGTTTVRVPIAIAPERWQDHVRRFVSPELAAADGTESFRSLTTAAPDSPVLYKVESGLLASAVWVAGVVTGTRPALELAAPSGATVEPIASALWASSTSDVLLAHFAFDRLPEGATYEARYWSDRRDGQASAPDRTWSVTIP